MKAFISDIPESGQAILTDALNKVYGENVIEIENIPNVQIRAKTRYAKSNVEVVLVVYSSSAESRCAGVDNGLFSSEKYITYTTDKEFQRALNSHYSLESEEEETEVNITPPEVEDVVEVPVEVPAEAPAEVVSIPEEVVESSPEIGVTSQSKDITLLLQDTLKELDYYKKLVDTKDVLNANLEQRIADLSSFYCQDGLFESQSAKINSLTNSINLLSTEKQRLEEEKSKIELELSTVNVELSSVKSSLSAKETELSKQQSLQRSAENELLEYKTKVLDLESKVSSSTSTISTLLKQKETVDKTLSTTSRSLDLANAKKVELETENTNLKSSIAKLELKISELEATISSLTAEKSSLELQVIDLEKLKSENQGYQSTISSLTMEKDSYKTQSNRVSALEQENSDLLAKASNSQEELESLKSLNNSLQDRVSSLEKDLLESTSKEEYAEKVGSLEEKVSSLTSTIQKKDDRIVEQEGFIKELNAKLLLANRQGNVAQLQQENQNLKDKLALTGNSVETLPSQDFSKLSYSSVIKYNKVYKNVSFLFSGSSESKRLTYRRAKQLYSNTNCLLVDLSSEGYSDYIFGITSKIPPCKSWLSGQKNASRYIVNIPKSRMKLLSVGMGFVNDMFYISSVDWDARLQELDELGIPVVIYCGDLSNYVARVLFNSFIKIGVCSVFIEGSVVSLRTSILALKGLSDGNLANVTVANAKKGYSDKFIEMLKKTNNCEVVEV